MIDRYQTDETSLAAYLIQVDFPLLEISYQFKPSGKRQATYLFDDTPELLKHITLFDTGKAVVNLVLYEHTKSGLIDRIMRGQQ